LGGGIQLSLDWGEGTGPLRPTTGEVRMWKQGLLVSLVVLLGLAAAGREDRSTTMVVVASKAMARYEIVKAENVKLIRRHVDAGDYVAELAGVVGKAVLDPVSADGVIPKSKLVDPAYLPGRVPMTVSVTASPDAPGLGELADVVVSPRNEKGGGLVLRNITVLGMSKGKDSVTYTIGVTEQQRQELAPLLGFSDVRVTQPPLPPA
jgi:hypothetical protein